jgi:hypothetical protein
MTIRSYQIAGSGSGGITRLRDASDFGTTAAAAGIQPS